MFSFGIETVEPSIMGAPYVRLYLAQNWLVEVNSATGKIVYRTTDERDSPLRSFKGSGI